jgi:hypothetical protein
MAQLLIVAALHPTVPYVRRLMNHRTYTPPRAISVVSVRVQSREFIAPGRERERP